MALDFSTLVYLPQQDLYSRSVTVTPIVSQPGVAAYTARGIFDTRDLDVMSVDGVTMISDQQTILDIREAEYSTLPQQGDLIQIPADLTLPALGLFVVVDTSTNGGGEMTLVLQRQDLVAVPYLLSF
jgi:hypothetical protein